MAKQSEEIKRLKLKLFEVEASLLFSQLRLRAFRDLATLIWESQKVTIHRTDPILTVLARMEKEYADLLLGEYAEVCGQKSGNGRDSENTRGTAFRNAPKHWRTRYRGFIENVSYTEIEFGFSP
jgi:hypothetical protein